MPSTAYNRVADNWHPLFAIAHVAGGDWPALALEAYTHLARQSGSSLSASGGEGRGEVVPHSAIRNPQSAIERGEVALSSRSSQPLAPSTIDLLTQIRSVFQETGATRISSKHLVDSLRALPAHSALCTHNSA